MKQKRYKQKLSYQNAMRIAASNPVARTVQASQTQPMPCILCGEPTYNRGMFIPKDLENAPGGAQPEDQVLVSFYALCEKHTRTVGTLREVERRLKMLSQDTQAKLTDR